MAQAVNMYLPTEPEGIEYLIELALDLCGTWEHSADELWGQLDPELWTLTLNPWAVLQTGSRAKLKALAADPAVREKAEALVRARRQYLEAPTWFQRWHADAPLTSVAYFSMEFMLSEALPIYSGGLGNVAGDQLKSASDLGVPVVGVGLLYQQGYFRQVLDAQGAQRAVYPYNDPGQLPITPVRDHDGEWVRLEFELPGYKAWVRAWQVQVGRATLYLLDTNDPANPPALRGISSELYGGGPEQRLLQEIILGMGGWLLLRTLGLQPEVCQLNEGHAAFAVLERARCFMEDNGVPFDVALAVTRAGNLFTTHTPVEAGFDRFTPALIEQWLGPYAQKALGIGVQELLALGRANPHDAHELFNMAYLAMRGSRAINGVSRLHGQVSRSLFQPLFPRWPQGEVPVGYVTNGVHAQSWASEAAEHLWSEVCGRERLQGAMEQGTIDAAAVHIRAVSDATLWELRNTARQDLVRYAREQFARQLAIAAAPTAEVEQAQQVFDPQALTLGFARRFATYKRPGLLLHDPERLLRILTHPERPVQLIVAGKAHPQDHAGQALVQDWVRFSQRPEARRHVLFLSDYDMLLASHLVQGVDVWINNPRRPWEASGTSGMKVLVNGGLNLSELDGWWAEAYTPEVGWALGDGQEHGDDPAWDDTEAAALFTLLEQEVIPAFYSRDANGIPTAWVARVRESMAQLTARFDANRTVREYTEQFYLPAAAAYRQRAADKGMLGAHILDWQRAVARHWAAVHFGPLQVETAAEQHVFQLPVYVGELDPDAVRVELYADPVNGGAPLRQVMTRGAPIAGATNGYTFRAGVPAALPATAYTPRLIPYHPEAAVPLEAAQILWQR
jgi:glycogen phosphorylase